MRRWFCDTCAHRVRFDALVCESCSSAQGYVPDDLSLRVVVADPDGVAFTIAGSDTSWWRCLNAAWGCNWMLPAGAGDVWCRSCRLTRGRPDDARSDAVAAWASVEASKRRLIHQLDSLGLAVDSLTAERSDGLVFDLVHLDDGGVSTGYSSGVVTLDLAEADERHREATRRQLSESFRTVIGHLRHEAGHHYFHRLIAQSDDLVEFRKLFGDEALDYAAALAAHYAEPAPWDPERHITAYATTHPLEDWAETFAHYLHICDGVETLDSDGIVAPDSSRPLLDDFEHVIGYWRWVSEAANDLAESLGLPAIYPFASTGRVEDKLHFVHRQVANHSARRSFYAPE